MISKYRMKMKFFYYEKNKYRRKKLKIIKLINNKINVIKNILKLVNKN